MHAAELRAAIALAYQQGDTRSIRNHCGLSLQASLVRDIKNGTLKHEYLKEPAEGQQHRSTLVSFVQQPVNVDRSAHLAQAVIRMYGQIKGPVDVILSSKSNPFLD